MSLPTGIATVTVSGTLLHADGSFAVGTVRFVPSVSVLYVGPNAVTLPSRIDSQLVAGVLTVVLPATDDAGGNPLNWTYKVEERVRGGRSFSMALPASPATQDYTDLVPVPANDGTAVVVGPANTDASTFTTGTMPDARLPATSNAAAVALKAPLASPAFTGTPTGITKAHVGLGNVDNTSDLNKPVSTAQTAAFDDRPQGFSGRAMRTRSRSTDQHSLRSLHEHAWSDLILGLLQTRKVAYATTVQYAATVGTVAQTIPGYTALTAGLGGNTTVKADCAYLTAVTAVYNLTADPGRATNLKTTFNADVQGLVLTGAPTIADVIEVVGTVLPYQGLFGYAPPTANYTTFEVLDWDGTIAHITDGTGGTTKALAGTALSQFPVLPKLPMPSGSVNSDFWCEPVLPSPNSAGVGSARRSFYTGASIAEGQPVLAQATGTMARFREGFLFSLATAWGRGAKQTYPQTHLFTWTLSPGGPYPNKHANVLHALVRVVSNVYADAAVYPVGRVFLMVATLTQTSGGGLAGTYSGESSTDLFALPTAIDNFDGMVTL